MCLCVWVSRTYADKLSPKVVQSLLDLLCSQLKNLLSQAGVNLLSSGSDRDNKKQEESAETEKKDIRGDFLDFQRIFTCLHLPAYTLAFTHSFPALIRKQRTAELHLGDFLVFLRRVVSSKAIQSKMASPKWTEVLLNIASQKCCSGRGQTAFSSTSAKSSRDFKLCCFLFRGSSGGELKNSPTRSACP